MGLWYPYTLVPQNIWPPCKSRHQSIVLACLTLLQKPRAEEHLAGSAVYSEEIILRLTKAVTTIFACMLPVASIIVLYVVQNMTKRLGIITAFTALFSVSLVSMTNAGMADIFAATAAYVLMQMEMSKANIADLVGMQLCRLFLSEPMGKATAPHHPRVPCRVLTWSSRYVAVQVTFVGTLGQGNFTSSTTTCDTVGDIESLSPVGTLQQVL
jgi:hypothetical protein